MCLKLILGQIKPQEQGNNHTQITRKRKQDNKAEAFDTWQTSKLLHK